MSVCAVRSAAMACICSALIAHSAYCQTSRQASTRIEGGGSFVLASAVGGFSDHVNRASGGMGHLDVVIGDSIFSVGGEFGWLEYGNVDRKADVSLLVPEIPGAELTVITQNYMVPMHARLRAQRKYARWQPYVDALFGGNLIATRTSISCSNDSSSCRGRETSATNARDFVLSVGTGGGVMIVLQRQPGGPTAKLDFSFRYLRGAEGTYLTQGAIRREGSTAVFNFSRSRTDMIAFYIGGVFGR